MEAHPQCSKMQFSNIWKGTGKRLVQISGLIMNLWRIRDKLQVVWDSISQEDIDHLISLPRRIEACITLRGALNHCKHFKAESKENVLKLYLTHYINLFFFKEILKYFYV